MIFRHATLPLLWIASRTAHGQEANGTEVPDGSITNLVPHRFPELGARRVKMDYVSHVVNGRDENDGMSQFQAAIQPPCTDCLITFMQADLKYPNGTTADAETGMWMHHVVLVNGNRNDTVCSSMPQRFFASGNERSPVDLTVGVRSWVGYPLHATDELSAAGELMSLLYMPQEVVFSMTWEFIPSILPNFEEAVPIWLDVGGCGDSDVPAKPGSEFGYTSPPVNSSFNGNIVMIGGHLHDGGTHLDVMRNDMIICTTEASYGDAASTVDGTAHISHIESCISAGRVTRGDQWTIRAHYDTIKHPPMAANDGSLEPVMGIALAYITAGDPTKFGGLYGTSLIVVIVSVVMALGLVGLYFARGASEKFHSAWNAIRYRGWQRVDVVDADVEDSETEDGLLLQQHKLQK